MKKLIRPVVILAAVLLLTVRVSAEAPLEAFAYQVDEAGGKVILEEYTGSEAEVTVPGSYTLAGKEYAVVLKADTVFRNNEALRAVELEAGIGFADHSMAKLFAGCTGLVRAEINPPDTSQVTDLSGLFYKCSALSQVDLSGLETGAVTSMRSMFSLCQSLSRVEGYENWDTGALVDMYQMFNQTASLKTIDLRRWDLDQVQNTGWCFQYCRASRILLPENLAVMSAGFLNHAAAVQGSSFTVPAGVKQIGYAHTFYDFGTYAFREFQVAEGNPCFKAVDGILYSADGTQLLAVPRGKTFPEGVFEIPEGVTFLGELSFSRNYNVQTLVLPNSYSMSVVERYDPEYILFEDVGNLNGGNTVNIALYRYTNVRRYGVREDNPNYLSREGVLYTKDGNRLVAVPNSYTGKLTVPQGVTHWEAGAMWCAGDTVDALMSGCTGVSLPASLTEISRDQLEKLNRLASRFSGFTITLDRENPAYTLDSRGQLVAKPRLEAATLTLEYLACAYDGTPKEPALTVEVNGRCLTEGEDYTLTYSENIHTGYARVTVTGINGYYGTNQARFFIGKGIPAYTLPKGLSGIYGQTLSQLTLPAGFTWTQPQAPVGPAGVNRAYVDYDPQDPDYAPVLGLAVEVTVAPKPVHTHCPELARSYPYTGKPITPVITVWDGDQPVSPQEYVLQFSHNQGLGTATVQITDKPGGNYTVTGGGSFRICLGTRALLAAAGSLVLAGAALGLLLKKRKQ